MSQNAYEKAVANLNAEQREAVEHIYGPVMVIAGPGTGKTQILATRIGNILMQTDTGANNVLCLTYTEAGTVAMRKRLNELIGPAAYNINIYTFHGFCNQIIRDHSELFSQKDELKAVDDLERLDFYIHLIDEWAVDHPLKKLKGDLYSSMSSLQELFRIMKSEGWSVEWIINRADQYLAELPTKEGFYYKRGNKKRGIEEGDPNLVKISEQTKKIDRLKVAARAFEEYSNLMTAGGRYDYEDMILWVLKEFSQNENLLFDVREQYQFILVDEYQDTNGAQNDILFKLCGDVYDQPNVFVVGDDDQAIYRFQGANLSNVLSFGERMGDPIFEVVLKENYRSSSSILSGAEALIDNNIERLSKLKPHINKHLQAGGENKEYAHPIYLGEFESETEELIGIQQYINQLLHNGAHPGSIAILFRKRKHVAPLIKYFSVEHIPHEYKSTDNIFEDLNIQKVLTLFRYLSDESSQPFVSDFTLFEIMHFNWFGVASIDIAHLALAMREKKLNNWRLFLSASKNWDHLPLQNAKSIHVFVNLLEEWIKLSLNNTVQHLFEAIIYAPPVFHYVKSMDQTYDFLKLTYSFFNFIKDQADKNQDLRLHQFLQVVDKMRKYDIPLPATKIEKTGDGIQLMTAHGSKGLEFDYVIVMGCNRSKWEGARAPSPKFTYPDTLVKSNKENKKEDERRLFYVAMTRAKKQLLLTYSKNLLNGKTASPSQFIEEVNLSGATRPWTCTFDESQKEQFLLSQYTAITRAENKLPAQVDDIVRNITLNISGVNKYLACPLSFYYENILRAPMALHAALGFGNAMHHALDKVFKHEKNEVGRFPSKKELLFYFSTGMDRFHANFTEKENKLYRANGEIKLSAYYDFFIEQWILLNPSKYEYKTANVHIEGIQVSGIFDRLDRIDDQYRVVDYKTGRALPYGAQKLHGPADNSAELRVQYVSENDADMRDKLRTKIQGGNYWRQLVFYKLLLQADPELTLPFHSAHVSFIESDDNPKYYDRSINITAEDELLVKNQLRKTFENIQNKQFSPGCGRSTCKWCQMI